MPRRGSLAHVYCVPVKGFARVLGVLAVVVLLLFAASRVLRRMVATEATGPQTDLIGAALPDLRPVADWLNADRSMADSLAGHPTVLALWSDTDPECLRALPVLESWQQAYARYGARVIGVHEPDFAFAADARVPERVAERLGLSFPIALDPTYAIRGALGEPADGPRVVLADGAGTIVAAGKGRAELAAIEQALRGLIEQLHPETHFPPDPGLATLPGATRAEPETRVVPLGVTRVREGPIVGATPGRAQPFTAQFRYQVEGKAYVPYPVGQWTPGGDGLTAARGGADNFVALRYDAGALWAVLGAGPGGAVRVWVLRDERWLPAESLGADARLDARGASYVDVSEPRLYAVCRALAGEHVVKLSPETPGLTVHALVVDGADAPRDH